MAITYGGDKYDPLADGDELSMRIVKKLAASFGHSYPGKCFRTHSMFIMMYPPILNIKADGTMDALLEKWTNGTLEQSVDMTGFTGTNGVLKIACDGTTPPWEYMYGSELTGYEIELVAMFCREYGYTTMRKIRK